MKEEKVAPVIACIIFNTDAILLNRETIMISALLDKAEEYGLNIELDDALSLFSEKGIEQNIVQLKNLFNVNVLDNFEETLRKKIYEELRYGLDAKEGIREMLERTEVPLCIVSNIPREEIEFNLRLTNLFDFFTAERILTTCEIGNQYEHAELYLKTAKSLGYEPAECAVITDNIAGLHSIVEKGFMVYGITNGFNEKEMRKTGAVVLEEIKEFPNFLKIV